jgi:hypothetical protein
MKLAPHGAIWHLPTMLAPNNHHHKYSFGAIFDAFWLAATFLAIWGAFVWLIGAVLFWH